MIFDIDKLKTALRAHGPTVAVEVVINFVAPFVIYDRLQHSLGDVRALIASSAPPVLWSLGVFAVRRRVDALSLFVVLGIALSLLAFVGGGGARMLQLREKLVTAAIGLVFLGSAAIGRPLIYQLARAQIARRRAPDALQSFESLRANVFFKRSMMLMTLVWGFGLVAEAGLSSTLVFTLSIRQYLLVSPIVGYGVMGGLGLWTFWFARRQTRLGQARRAAAAADPALLGGDGTQGARD